MNDKEQNFNDEIPSQQDDAIQSAEENQQEPSVQLRDVFSSHKDEQLPEMQQGAAEQQGNTFTSYSTSNPFDSYHKREVETPRREPAAEEPAFNPYAPPSRKAEDPFSAGAYQSQQSYPYGGNPPQGQYHQQDYSQPHYSGPDMTPPKKSKGKTIAFIVAAVCVVVALGVIVTGLFGNSGSVQNTTGDSQPENTTAINTTQSTTKPQNLDNINSVYIADKVRPSVVGVMAYVDGQLAGEGSGVLWGEDSTGKYTYVVTCAHVINEKGLDFGILLLDGRTFEAEMVASDTRTDIGVLRIEATGLPLADIGDSSTLKIGEPIYAIGNPGGSEYFGSITDGIVSAIDRSVSATYTMTCIQHNAAINPGNSGGALVNTAGQIVGINSSKIASTEYEGMGFAVPTSIAKSVVESLIAHGYVPNRPKLGIQYASVNAYQVYSMVVSIKGLPQGSLVIAGISSDSSLAGTKAEVGDLIIAVNGKDMDDSSVLLDLIDTGTVGDTLTLTLCRIEQRTYKTTTFDVTITLVEDKGDIAEETTTETYYGKDDYYHGGAESFEDFFDDFFGFGW